MNKIVTLFILTLLLVSCSGDKAKRIENKRDLYLGKWDIADAQSPLVDEGEARTLNERRRVFRNQLADNVIVFNSDSTFFLKLLHDSPVIIGRWHFNEENSALDFEITNNYDMPFSIDFPDVSSRKLVCQLSLPHQIAQTHKAITLTFLKNDPEFENSEYNFAKYDLNTWRIKASEKQSRDQILERVRNCLNFTIYYLKYCKTDDKKNVAHTSLTSFPLYYARNGVELNRNQEWDALFFDQEDADASYEIIGNAMLSGREQSQPEDLSSKSPLDINIYILEQIHKELK